MKLRNYDGLIAICTQPAQELRPPQVFVWDEVSIYKYTLVPMDQRNQGWTCEGCGRTDNDTETPWDKRLPLSVPLYNCFPIDHVDTMGGWLEYCQECLEKRSDGTTGPLEDDDSPDYGVHYYSGKYGGPHDYNEMEWPPEDPECTKPHLDSAWEDIPHPVSACKSTDSEQWFCSTCGQPIPKGEEFGPPEPFQGMDWRESTEK